MRAPMRLGGLLGAANPVVPVDFNARSMRYLSEVNPMLRDLMIATEDEAERRGIEFEISEGMRDRARQAELVAQGLSQTMNSRHLTGNAVDIHILNPDGSANWDFDAYRPVAEIFQQQAAAMSVPGPVWGGDWRTLRDGVHFQIDGPNAPQQPAPRAPSVMAQNEAPQMQSQPQGLLASMSTMNGPTPRPRTIWDTVGERVPMLSGLADPDRRARLAIGLEGLALNPNQALVQTLQGDMEARRDDRRMAQTAAWLRSQPGGEMFAAALEAGANSDAVFDAYMQSQAPANPMDAVALEMAQLQLEQMRQPTPGYRVLSPEETAALGLEGTWQQAPTGELEPLQSGGDPTAGMREYELARQQGFTGSFVEYQQALAEARRDQTNVNVNTGSDAFTDETGKILAQEAAAVVEQGATAQRNMGLLLTLENQLATSPSGLSAAFAQLAGELGIATDGLDSLQTANSVINRLIPEQRKPGTGDMSDADIEMFRQSLPRLINTPEGNRRIIDTLKAIAEYDVARMNIARAQQLGQIDAQEAFARYNALGNPLAGFVTDPPPESASGAELSDEDLLRMYGGQQ